MNPQNSDSKFIFLEWKCKDDEIIIKEDGTIIANHDCTVYPNWVKSTN